MLRRADVERQQVAIDFVVHGDEAIAAPWAARAEPGELLALSGAGGAQVAFRSRGSAPSSGATSPDTMACSAGD